MFLIKNGICFVKFATAKIIFPIYVKAWPPSFVIHSREYQMTVNTKMCHKEIQISKVTSMALALLASSPGPTKCRWAWDQVHC